MIPKRLDRRAVLRGAGGIAVGLPWLEIMSYSKSAQAAEQLPKRFMTWFTPNGTVHENWVPKGTETDFTLSRILTPLEAFKSKIVVVDSLNNESAKHGPGDGHQCGMGTLFTGTELTSGNNKGGCDSCPSAGLAGGISIDQKIANAVGGMTKAKSLEFGVNAGSGTVWNYVAYTGADKPLQSENNPNTIFNRVFTDVGANQASLSKQRSERKSVLDAVLESYKSLTPKLGQADSTKLDAHLTEIRDLETRLTAGAALGASCTKPTVDQFDYKSNDKYPQAGKLQMDLLVMAFACDLTRVASLCWNSSVGGATFSWLGITRGHHDISHDGNDNADSMDKLTQIDTWYAQQLAYLLDKMNKISEGSGTLLDNVLLLSGNELARGNAHSHDPMPFLLAGGAGGALRTGRFLQYPKDKAPMHNNLLVSCLNAMGVADQSFGNPAYCTGPLANL